MHLLLQELSETLLSKKWEDCQPMALQELTNKYPSCASLQLLLSQKLKQQNDVAYDAQWQQTLLYFNNPLFVNHLFQQPESNAAVIHEKANEILEEQLVADATDCSTIHEDEVPLPPLKITPIDAATAQLAFTPYYTVDYFASQGIKLMEDKNDKDAFGTQLKSFTQWLKEMRRLPEAQVTKKFNAHEALKVEQMAQQSLYGENAITESMAKVWMKQNAPAKAIDIYKKLSLQNPSKSAYFAAKIEHLKKLL